VRRIIFAALLLTSAVARADAPSGETVDVARQHYRLGLELYMKSRFDEAAIEFETGYRLQPQPLFLYNIAQSARRAGRVDKAIDYYQRYLAASPNAPERAEVERQLVELEQLRAASRPPQAATATTPAAAPAPRSRRGLWIGLGVGGAAVVVAAVATGLALGLTRGAPSSELGNHVFVGQ
jgi:tetratricopeptide (TPR) repeat protein